MEIVNNTHRSSEQLCAPKATSTSIGTVNINKQMCNKYNELFGDSVDWVRIGINVNEIYLLPLTESNHLVTDYKLGKADKYGRRYISLSKSLLKLKIHFGSHKQSFDFEKVELDGKTWYKMYIIQNSLRTRYND